MESKKGEKIMEQKNVTVWFMGLPCSGKTTLASMLNRTPTTIHLDGDVLRKGVCKDLGFSIEDRVENIRRASAIAELLNKNGHNVTASFITPTKDVQNLVKKTIKNLVLVYIKCDLEACIKRDVKGMYKKAQSGEIKDFTGISAPFEEPYKPDIVCDTTEQSSYHCWHYLEDEIPKFWRGY